MGRNSGCRYLLFAATLLAVAPTAVLADDSDDPNRGVARISLINGDVTVRRGDSGDWVAAAVNAPLVAEDRVATGPTSRTEIQFDAANMIRLAGDSEVRFTELGYHRYMMQLARGTATFSVLRTSEADVEVDTPNVSLRPSKKGRYRVHVRDDGESEITVRSGDLEVFTPKGSQRLHSGQSMMVRGTASDPEFQIASATSPDDWDHWNEQRDSTLLRARSNRYVYRDVYGVEDLDPYGSWVYVAPYGYCWRPVVVAGWAPYRYGRWVWMDWYGWSWVSYDPWGWAPYHYGRWFWGGGGWCWYPGAFARTYWSPGFVAFFGFGSGFHAGFGFGNVGWVPLAPFERFHPWWGRGYYGGYSRGGYIDRSVNIVNNVNIVNTYRNARVNNGLTAVRSDDFGRGQFTHYSPVGRTELNQAGLVRGQMPLVPGRENLRFSDAQPRNVPRGAEPHQFSSRRQPAAVERVSFADQRRSFEPGAAARGNAADSGMRRNAGAGPAVARGAEPGTGRSNAAAAGSTGSGWRPAERPGAQVAQSGSSSANASRGWRRFGEPAGSGSAGTGRTTARGPEGAATPRASDTARPGGSSPAAPRTAENGWHRFNDRPQAEARPAQGTQTPGGRAGTPARTPDARTPERSSGWSRFGDPGAARNSAPDARSRTELTPRGMGRSEAAMPRGASRQESLPMAPPVVRERAPQSAPVPRSYGGGSPRGYEAPSRGGAPAGRSSAPAAAPSGGGHASRSESGGRSGGRR